MAEKLARSGSVKDSQRSIWPFMYLITVLSIYNLIAHIGSYYFLSNTRCNALLSNATQLLAGLRRCCGSCVVLPKPVSANCVREPFESPPVVDCGIELVPGDGY